MKNLLRIITPLLAVLATLVLPLNAAQVRSGETVSITIKGVPASEQTSINGQYVISDGGLIYMPMLNYGIKASGNSSSALARRIEAAYKSAEIYNNPRITIITAGDEIKGINDRKQANRFVTVAGHVKRPGPVQYNDGMTIYEAVAAAGDASTFGAMNRVEVLRGGRKRIYNMKTDVHRTLKVNSGDIITVPEKNMLGR